jgi:hypothetical protein
MLAGLLASGLVFVSCDNSDDDDGGPYLLEWGSFNTTYAAVYTTIGTQGWTVTDLSPGGPSTYPGQGYVTGAEADSVYDYCMDPANGIVYNGGGKTDGSFAGLLNYKAKGVGLPDTLKTALAAQEANVPVAGIFDADVAAVVFYVRKN